MFAAPGKLVGIYIMRRYARCRLMINSRKHKKCKEKTNSLVKTKRVHRLVEIQNHNNKNACYIRDSHFDDGQMSDLYLLEYFLVVEKRKYISVGSEEVSHSTVIV